MHELDVVAALHAAMLVTLKLCTPLLLAPLITGLTVAVFQAVTQINDSTVSFLPKLCAVIASGYYAGPYMARTIGDFMHHSFEKIVLIGGQ
jgi:flagellar biosynthetic protein FliQ